MKTKSLILFSLKLALSVGVLLYVYNKIDVGFTLELLANAKIELLFAACFIITLTFMVNAFRVKMYFDNSGYHFPYKFIVKHFFSGSFLGLTLPGTLGCDGYVCYKLNEAYKYPVKPSLKLVLNSRLNGLFFMVAIFVIAVFLSSFNGLIANLPLLLLLLLALVVLAYWVLSKLYFNETLKMFFKASWNSILIQILMCSSAYLIFLSLGHKITWLNVASIFLITNIIHMLPISIGGIGFRELVFFKGFVLLGYNPEIGVAFSAVFFIIFALSSLPGLYFLIRK